MGELYRARDKRLNRDVAGKVLGEGLGGRSWSAGAIQPRLFEIKHLYGAKKVLVPLRLRSSVC